MTTLGPRLSERAAPLPSRRGLLGRSAAAAAEPASHWLRVQRRAMACWFELTLDEADARWLAPARAALTQLDAIESRLSVFRSTSAISDINRRAVDADVACDRDLFDLLARCETLSRATDGAFDITSTALSRCWGFLRREGRVPSTDEIASARANVGMGLVHLDRERGTVRFAKPGVALNLGAIGKGYALDCIADSLQQEGVNRVLLSAGRSSLLAIGGKGAGWPVDLVSPRRERPIARVWLRGAALGTSGAGEQFVIADGQRFGHVIDPRTGRPSSDMLSASVVCANAADADALSTAFLIGGPALASRYCDRHPGVLVLLTPDDGSGDTLVIGRRSGADVEEP
jgi:thiamine biosynthesis lipoprotein